MLKALAAEEEKMKTAKKREAKALEFIFAAFFSDAGCPKIR